MEAIFLFSTSKLNLEKFPSASSLQRVDFGNLINFLRFSGHSFLLITSGCRLFYNHFQTIRIFPKINLPFWKFNAYNNTSGSFWIFS